MKRVLIVDNEENFRVALREILKEEGYECEEANDGEQALCKMELLTIDLVITDLRMPNLDGGTLIKRMSEHDQCQNIPVICVTAYEQYFPKDVKRPTTILIKPVDVDVLLLIIKKLLKFEGSDNKGIS